MPTISKRTALGLALLGGLTLAGLTVPGLGSPANAATIASRASGQLEVAITVRDSAGRVVATTNTRNGKFTLTLPPGDYQFFLRVINNSETDTATVEPGIIAVLIGLLLPSGKVEPVSSDRLPLVRAASGAAAGHVSFQDLHFTRVLPAPRGAAQSADPVNGYGGLGGGRYTVKPGQAFTYQGSATISGR